MDPQTDAATDMGIGGRLNWLISGALGGLLGATLFGAVLWTLEPQIVSEVIPEIYGFEASGLTGWLFHLLHGVVLGIVFGFLITRHIVLGTLTADVETPFLARMGLATRLVLAGLVYGLVIWVFLPGIITTVMYQIGVLEDPFPAAASANLVGHLLYGMILGGCVAMFIDLERDAEDSDSPFEEPEESPAEPPGN